MEITFIRKTGTSAADIHLRLDHDWWLFDRTQLAIMDFNGWGRPLGGEITDDPETVERHCAWRTLALRHATAVGQTHDA